MARSDSAKKAAEQNAPVKVTAIELTEKNFEKNRFSCIRLSFDSWRTRTGELTSRVTYSRRYDLNAEFDSVSNYFQISDTVVKGCRDFIVNHRLLEDYPAKKSSRRPGSYSEIRVFSGLKVVSRVVKRGPIERDGQPAAVNDIGKSDVVDEMFEELSRLLKRTLG
ncbi:MAG: hypothetical protein K6B54_00785 [Clostridia bacterium]|nr:hypothetical protein [Clostridia bacterium]